MPSAFFALVIFLIGPHVLAQAGLDRYPPAFTSCLAGMAGAHHHTQLFIG
jgi:hypothetical protein